MGSQSPSRPWPFLREWPPLTASGVPGRSPPSVRRAPCLLSHSAPALGAPCQGSPWGSDPAPPWPVRSGTYLNARLLAQLLLWNSLLDELRNQRVSSMIIRQISVAFSLQPCRIKGDIGQSTDEDSAPLVHCVRLLSASFLLTGEKNGENQKAGAEFKGVTLGFRGHLGHQL